MTERRDVYIHINRLVKLMWRLKLTSDNVVWQVPGDNDIFLNQEMRDAFMSYAWRHESDRWRTR